MKQNSTCWGPFALLGPIYLYTRPNALGKFTYIQDHLKQNSTCWGPFATCWGPFTYSTRPNPLGKFTYIHPYTIISDPLTSCQGFYLYTRPFFLNQSKSSILFILVSMVTHNQILFLTKILDLISFHMLQTRPLYHYYEHEVIAKTVLTNQNSAFCLYWLSMVTHNQILFLAKILDLISFHMLQTRSLYHYFS